MKKLLYIGIAAAILGCTKSEELSTSAADGVISFSAGEIATRVTDGGTSLSWETAESINITDGTKSANSGYDDSYDNLDNVNDDNNHYFKLKFGGFFGDNNDYCYINGIQLVITHFY